MRNRLWLLVGTIAFISACGSQGTGVSSSERQVESTSDTTLAVEESKSSSIRLQSAAMEYVDLVRPTNCALFDYRDVEDMYSLGNDQVDLAGLTYLASAMEVVAYERDIAISKLVSTEWPIEVKDDMAALALYWSAVYRAEVALATASDQGTWDSAMSAYRDLGSSNDAGRSKIIRLKLGVEEFSPAECG